MHEPRVMLPVNDYDLINLHLGGKSVKALAERFGVSRTLIVGRMRRLGVKQRNRSESMRVRMGATSPEERSRLTRPAHDAIRGKPHTEQHRVKIAKGREISMAFTSTEEIALAIMLKSRGLAPKIQMAVGRYNIDVAVEPDLVAVEVNGGQWHASPRKAGVDRIKRKYLTGLGWTIMYVWVFDGVLTTAAADKIVALVDRVRGRKSCRGEHWMIRGDGQPMPKCGTYDDYLS